MVFLIKRFLKKIGKDWYMTGRIRKVLDFKQDRTWGSGSKAEGRRGKAKKPVRKASPFAIHFIS